jgi:hypothetical protein
MRLPAWLGCSVLMTLLSFSSVAALFPSLPDIDGDGIPDLVWRNPRTGANSIWFLPNIGATGVPVGVFIKDATTQQIIYTPSTDWKIVRVGRFHTANDTKRDLLWRNQALDQTAIWSLNQDRTATVYSYVLINYSIVNNGGSGTLAKDWKIVGAADFDKDGKTDILWQHTPTVPW